jgi:hypothetical protein
MLTTTGSSKRKILILGTSSKHKRGMQALRQEHEECKASRGPRTSEYPAVGGGVYIGK